MNAVTITVTIPLPPSPPGNGTVSYFLRIHIHDQTRQFATVAAAAEEMIRLGTENCTMYASCMCDEDYICTRWSPRQQTWGDWL